MPRAKTEQRADVAHTTLLAHQTYSGDDKSKFDVEEQTKRLLADLMHLSGEYAFTLEGALKEAQEIYTKECEEEACGPTKA